MPTACDIQNSEPCGTGTTTPENSPWGDPPRAREVPAYVGIALVICVVAPVFEELFFRGYFFSALHSSMNVWWAAILGGLAFGLLHILNVLTGVPIETAIVSTVSLTVFGFLRAWSTGAQARCTRASAPMRSTTPLPSRSAQGSRCSRVSQWPRARR